VLLKAGRVKSAFIIAAGIGNRLRVESGGRKEEKRPKAPAYMSFRRGKEG
jgi:hypothetical protein